MVTRRIIKGFDEEDVHTKWRHRLCITSHAGYCAAVKRSTNRRERREGRRWIAESLDS